MNDDTTYLMWRETDKKKPLRDKIAAACARFTEKFGIDPNVALVGEGVAIEHIGSVDVIVEPRHIVPNDTIYVGFDEARSIA